MKASKLKSLLGVALTSPVALSLNAATLLTEGHTDIGMVYELGAWNFHIGQHEAIPPMEYAPDEAILGVDIVAASNTVPANPQLRGGRHARGRQCLHREWSNHLHLLGGCRAGAERSVTAPPGQRGVAGPRAPHAPPQLKTLHAAVCAFAAGPPHFP